MPAPLTSRKSTPPRSLATPLGFEPRITPPKGAVLPLHHGVSGFAILDSRFSIQVQCPKFKPDLGYPEQLGATIEVELGGGAATLKRSGYGAHNFPSALRRLP